MNCQSFDASLLDAMYDELDTRSVAAMDEHARTCAACAGRAARLHRTRELTTQHLAIAVPEGLEARILAAVDGASKVVVPLVPLAARRERTGIVAVLSRPYFAVAASVLLVIGAATLLLAPSAKRAAPAAASQAEAPLAASPAPATPPMAVATAVATTEPEPAAAAAPAAVAVGRASMDAGAYAAKAARPSAVPATKAAAKPASPRATASAVPAELSH